MSCRLIEVIEAIVPRGCGTEENPYRSVVQYWTKEGQLLAEDDPRPVSLPDYGRAPQPSN